uniref:Pco119358 n=1 Tax=Arundo donax TaxID=35708 RepID=A0A0A9G6N6_ARUDO
MVRFISSSPSSYMFFIKSMIPDIGSFSLSTLGLNLSSLKCRSNQLPFEALQRVITTFVGFTTTLHFSGTISLFSFGMAQR